MTRSRRAQTHLAARVVATIVFSKTCRRNMRLLGAYDSRTMRIANVGIGRRMRRGSRTCPKGPGTGTGRRAGMPAEPMVHPLNENYSSLMPADLITLAHFA